MREIFWAIRIVDPYWIELCYELTDLITLIKVELLNWEFPPLSGLVFEIFFFFPILKAHL